MIHGHSGPAIIHLFYNERLLLILLLYIILPIILRALCVDNITIWRVCVYSAPHNIAYVRGSHA